MSSINSIMFLLSMQMFFYANRGISVDEADFWEKSYLLRLLQCWKLDVESCGLISNSSRVCIMTERKETDERESISLSGSAKGKEQSTGDVQACPLFIKDIAKSIVSAGKSLQLIRHVPAAFTAICGKSSDNLIDGLGNSTDGGDLGRVHCGQSIAGLTLSEIFCISLAGLIGHGDHISRYFWQDDPCESGFIPSLISCMNEQKVGNGNTKPLAALTCSEKMWCKFFLDTLTQKQVIDKRSTYKVASDVQNIKEESMTSDIESKLFSQKSIYPENPVITMCETLLNKNKDVWEALNLSRNFYLPPLNDEVLRGAVLGVGNGNLPEVNGTNYAFGFQFGKSEYLRSQYDTQLLEALFPFPTILPSFQVKLD